MSTNTLGSTSTDVQFNRGRLFVASCIALITTAMTFAVRGDSMPAFAKAPFNLNETAIGWAMLGAFWGFTLAMMFGGPLCDWLGMGRLLKFALVGHIAGTALVIYSTSFFSLAVAIWILGIANGLVEAAINPLVATIYPDQKVHKLNMLHAWFPGGIVIGSLVAYFISPAMGEHWQLKMGTVFVPAIIYGFLFLGQKFPETERVQSGVSTRDMYRETFKPLFLVFFCCMWLTAATELGTNQWISKLLSDTAGTGILVLAWISIVMCVGRLVCGPMVHKISPVAILFFSALISIVGLLGMSIASTKVMAFAASTVFAVGVCYFWPTMLGVTSERFPAGGALLLAIMGGTGMLSSGIAQPIIGKLVDKYGPQMALQYTVVLPAILVIVFGIIYLYDKGKGGYKVVKLGQPEAAPEKADEAAEVEKV